MEPENVQEVREGVSWDAFAAYIEEKDDAQYPRIAYLDGGLELVTPSNDHEVTHRWIGSLLDAYTDVAGIEMSSIGAWLLQGRAQRAGAEPDDCYVVGPNARAAKRPNFVIEVEWSHRRLDKLEIWRRLGVHEVWRWPSPRARRVVVHVLVDGGWVEGDRSPTLPDLDLDLLCACLDRPTQKAAKRDYLAALAARAT